MLEKIIDRSKKFPEYVFGKKYTKFYFIVFSDIFSQKLQDLLECVCLSLVRDKLSNIYVFEIDLNENLKKVNKFELKDYKEITKDILNYEEEISGVPQYVLIGNTIIITSDGHEYCIYCNRDFDIAIFATNDEFLNKDCCPDVLERMSVTQEEYFVLLRSIIKEDKLFSKVKSEIFKNYKSY